MSNVSAATQLDHHTAAAASQYLTFRLATEEYGVDILRVQEIKGWDKITRIPKTEKFILGVINLRGTVVPILDLRSRFGLEAISFGPTTVIIVVHVTTKAGQRTVGLVVDAVSEVYSVAPESVKPAPEVCAGVDTMFVKGLVTKSERMLILLDIDRLIGNCIDGTNVSTPASA
jgi:purine-binding chemotaxis protein CheW